MRPSSCASLSLTLCSGLSKKVASVTGIPGESREGDTAGTGDCCAATGTAASRMVPRTRLRLHFHPAHLIELSAPLFLDSTVGGPHFVARDYTHPGRAAQFEIFIAPIDFSDAGYDSKSQAIRYLSWFLTVAQGPSNREVLGGISRVPQASSFPTVPACVRPFAPPCVLLCDDAYALFRRRIRPIRQIESGREATVPAPARKLSLAIRTVAAAANSTSASRSHRR